MSRAEVGGGSISKVTNSTNIIVMGAKGRMGQMILQASRNFSGVTVRGAVEYPGSPDVGKPTGVEGVSTLVTDSLAPLLEKGSVVIDFTHPEATMENVRLAEKTGVGVVIGTTGLTAGQKEVLAAASKNIPILLSPNMSLGVNLSFKISELVASVLGEDFDVEIVEAHHRHKKDAPSGTALGLAEAVARGRKIALEEKAVYGREGLTGERPPGEIGIHAIRGGDIAGDHTVLFAGEGERVEIRHMAHNRTPFATGAIKAALFLNGKNPGMYSMADVLSLK